MSAETTAIVQRHARLNNNGRPQFCHAASGKVIYANHASAVAAAREIETATGDRSVTYKCDASKSGHHHLATRETA